MLGLQSNAAMLPIFMPIFRFVCFLPSIAFRIQKLNQKFSRLSLTLPSSKYGIWSSHRGAAVNESNRNHEVAGSIPGLAQWVEDLSFAISCGVGCRRGWDPALLWLWRRLAATAPVRPLAWEPPYAMGVAPKNSKKKRRNNCHSV